MSYSSDHIDEIVAVQSAARPEVDDFLIGSSGADVMEGTYTFDPGPVNSLNVGLIGDAGNDILNGAEGDDLIYPGPGSDIVIGGTGTDAVAFVDATSAVTADLGLFYAEQTGERDTLSTVENVLGSEFGDHLYGDAGGNVLDGWDGDD